MLLVVVLYNGDRLFIWEIGATVDTSVLAGSRLLVIIKPVVILEGITAFQGWE